MFVFSLLRTFLSQNVELCKRLSTPPGKDEKMTDSKLNIKTHILQTAACYDMAVTSILNALLFLKITFDDWPSKYNQNAIIISE